ncbi:hypothetical protein [Halalkalicoccus sp. NIPERK01]|uniref:hypothetical protein n=1 Tax=Halalkalicoccus sp. NIPERK01 TaxID=3053469 RepID=UPI00256EEE96|nr:hypothetical protein [Halalkalicoccus sp. NIPERK01]MDL5363307.1 hypothetical protein [Halalkalicoccus sp. NIPERK01]
MTDEASALECYRRACEDAAEFRVYERYQEENDLGAVEAEVALCRRHAAEERPSNLGRSYPGYVFRVDPIGDGPVEGREQEL